MIRKMTLQTMYLCFWLWCDVSVHSCVSYKPVETVLGAYVILSSSVYNRAYHCILCTQWILQNLLCFDLLWTGYYYI